MPAFSIRPTLVKSLLVVLSLGLAACSTSNSSDATRANAKSSNGTKVTANARTPKQITTSLAQRPSEINVKVKGKVTRTGEVYLLRGLANVFSRGMDTLGVKMIRKGLDARVYNHSAWRSLADNIVVRARAKQVSYPIIIMGHSLGANAAANMAKYLGDKGVRVDYVVGFDPTVTTVVGRNVKRVVNFYLPNDSNSNVVRKAPGFRGTLKNVNVRGVRGITHTTIEKDPKFHNDVIKRTLSFTKRKRVNRRKSR